MDRWQVARVLKEDSLGRVELLEGPGGRALRRVAAGGRIPLSGALARVLLARERRALRALEGLAGVPRLLPEDALEGRRALLRGFVAGEPLHRAGALPEDFFDRLDELVQALHARGVCHNDLHKEQNVLVGADGFPWLIDFQLASLHAARGALFESRARDDLRHVEKHRRRYTRAGRAPDGGDVLHGRGHGLRRSLLARVWRRGAKPVYNWLTRRVLGWRDGEARRPESGPWPRWTPAVGPRHGARRDAAAPR